MVQEGAGDRIAHNLSSSSIGHATQALPTESQPRFSVDRDFDLTVGQIQ